MGKKPYKRPMMSQERMNKVKTLVNGGASDACILKILVMGPTTLQKVKDHDYKFDNWKNDKPAVKPQNITDLHMALSVMAEMNHEISKTNTLLKELLQITKNRQISLPGLASRT